MNISQRRSTRVLALSYRFLTAISILVGLTRIAVAADDSPPSAQFAVLDQNRDQHLDYKEALTGATSDDLIVRHWRFYESDFNDDDQLTESEYTGWAGGRPMAPRRQFACRDVNRDAVLTLAEFQQWSAADAATLMERNFRFVDFDGDDRLSQSEFLALPWIPLADRGPIPDPILQAAEERIAVWEKHLAASDQDADGRLSKSEWPEKSLQEWGPLGQIPFAGWDRDQDGAVTLAEARLLIEIANGIRRSDGELLRLPSGFSLDWVTFRRFDRDGDGQISKDEFVASYWDKERSEVFFQGLDKDGNGHASLAEIRASTVMSSDVLGQFLGWDASLNGRLNQHELQAKSAPWQQSLSRRLIAAFDTDADGELSLVEYRTSPFGNPATDWYFLRSDADHDGQLSFQEFYREESPLLVDLYYSVFVRLDRNHDSWLTSDELEFHLDPQRAPADKVFRWRDRDTDGRLTWNELFPDTLAADADDAAKHRHAQRQKFTVEILKQGDRDGDDQLDLAEYQAAGPERILFVFGDYIRRDVDADGRVTREEYIRPNIGSQWEQAARAESELFDLDDDGVLSWKEFQNSPPGGPSHAQRFAGLDRNEDQTLTASEYLHMFPLAEQRNARLFFGRKDSNGDGSLDFAEWEANSPVSWRREFQARDVDGDDRLSQEEFLIVYGEPQRKEAIRNFQTVDFDRDGTLSRDEYSVLPGSGASFSERGSVPDPILNLAHETSAAFGKLFSNRDANSDGRLTEAEWPLESLNKWGPLGQAPFAIWDLDQDGAVTVTEAERWIDIACGIRRPDGELIRLQTGLTLDWVTFRRMDKDSNGRVSREEFVTGYWAGEEKNAELFQGMDADKNGEATLAEVIANPVMMNDTVGHFLWLDSNWNGRLDAAELLAKSAPWQISLAPRLIPAFDTDADHELSFMEFRRTPFANPGTDWYFRRRDADSDGALTFTDFYTETAPAMMGQYWSVFSSLDRNHDGKLTFDELEFDADWSKVNPEIRFRAADRNHDGQLTFDEHFTTPAPSGDAAQVARHERLRLYHAGWFEKGDLNQDGTLSSDEYVRHLPSYQPALFEGFLGLDTDHNGQLSYAEYIQPTLGSKWEPFATAEAPLFDLNDDGQLSWNEFRISPRGAPTVEQRFEGLDANGDDQVSENEYLHTIPVEQRRQSRVGFCHIDADGDGYASRDEWLLQGSGPRTARTEFRARDLDGNGRLTLDEFIGVLDETWRRHGQRDFRVADQDGDRELTLDEFRCVPGVTSPQDRGPVADIVVDWMERPLKEVLEIVRRKDRDQDGRLSVREWPEAEIQRVSAALGSITVRNWDLDRDGYVTIDECRGLLERAYGICLMDGSVVRLPNGRVVNVGMLRQFDADQDGVLSRTEFVSKFWIGPEKSREIFKTHDKDGDGRWDWSEMQASPEMTADVLGQFLWFDTDLDGFVDQAELDAKMADWQRSIGARLIRAFCTSGDGRMSFQDFRSTPFANPVADWYAPRADKNHDARLSWSEYYTETSPNLIGLHREYFDRFDLDHDGSLSYDELEFNVDLDKVTPEIAFRMLDKNGDGKLVLAEVFTEPKPTAPGQEVLERYEMRLGAAETRFLADDTNRDGSLDVSEFQQSKEASLRAVERKTKALSRQRGNQPSNLPFIAFLVLDALVLVGAGWFVMTKVGKRNP